MPPLRLVRLLSHHTLRHCSATSHQGVSQSLPTLPCCCIAVDLRETCQAGDATVSASNESTRDSIFRAAVNMALKAALQENAKLAGLRPQQFVGGIARDLGAPPVSLR